MNVLKHGNVVKFVCEECGCEFTELPNKCYSSTGGDGAHYVEACPDCASICYTTDETQKKLKESKRDG